MVFGEADGSLGFCLDLHVVQHLVKQDLPLCTSQVPLLLHLFTFRVKGGNTALVGGWCRCRKTTALSETACARGTKKRAMGWGQVVLTKSWMRKKSTTGVPRILSLSLSLSLSLTHTHTHTHTHTQSKTSTESLAQGLQTKHCSRIVCHFTGEDGKWNVGFCRQVPGADSGEPSMGPPIPQSKPQNQPY